MRTRDEIMESALIGSLKLKSEEAILGLIQLEILLDIREMLMPLAHPIYVVEDVPLGFDELTQKYKDVCGTSLRMTGIKRTPTGDIVTTQEVKNESKTDSKN